MPTTKSGVKIDPNKPTDWAALLRGKTVDEKLAAGWQYISIPEKNPVFSKAPHPPIRFNELGLEAGRTYLLPPEIAASAKERLATYHISEIRKLQPDVDATALEALQGDNVQRTRNFSPQGSSFAVADAAA